MSYGSSQGSKAVIKNADMTEDMQQAAVDCAQEAMQKFNLEKDIAAHVKKEFDKRYNPTWHCIVGRNFGRYDLFCHTLLELACACSRCESVHDLSFYFSYVTHETKHFIYFYMGQVAILLFKSG